MINEKWQELLVKHKKRISALQSKKPKAEDDSWIFKEIDWTGLFLIMAYCNFKCIRCGSDQNLTLQHLIQRKHKKQMVWDLYVVQRHYWANTTILCIDCHAKADQVSAKDMLSISEDKIKKIKKYFGLEWFQVAKKDSLDKLLPSV